MDLPKLIICLVVPQLIGLCGVPFTKQGLKSWYPRLKKPSFQPPSWLFGPVWTILYFLIGIATYIVWTTASPLQPLALGVNIVQLLLNAIWTPVFFGLRSPLLGLIIICMLWLSIIITILMFFQIASIAGVLLIPYLLWVSFASLLNFKIWQKN